MELRLQRIGSLAPAHRAPRQARQHRAIFVTLRRFRTRAEQGTPKTQLQGEQTQVLKRSMFPKDFLFGCATSAYQVEGAAAEGGRGPSIWDEFSHTEGKTLNGDTGDVACDQYHRFQEDISLMGDVGWGAYRFSISWSRVLPEGTGPVNEEGIGYYNRLIDCLLANGVAPYATLFHWDLPLALHNKYGGFLSPQIVDAFEEYAELCFSRFGDRVKNWMTFNEPLTFSTLGYCTGEHAPGRCSDRTRCAHGDSGAEPYLVVHHILLSHAAAVNLYRREFQAQQRGRIGIAADSEWAEPASESPADRAAAQRRLEFLLGWVLDPLYTGAYPASMVSLVPGLPEFSGQEAEALRSAGIDFLGLNHYTSRFIAGAPPHEAQEGAPRTFFTDQRVAVSTHKGGVPIGWQAASPWLIVVPCGVRKLLLWITERYGRPPIMITENGLDEWDVPGIPIGEALNDQHRVLYYSSYLSNVAEAISEGADVRGYFAWSFMDNFEWQRGFMSRFGIIHVDWASKDLTRRPKASAAWWRTFLST